MSETTAEIGGSRLSAGAVSGGRKRGRPRAFDHDEAKRRYRSGERAVDLAAAYGVSLQSIYVAINDRFRKKQYAAARRRIEAARRPCRGGCGVLVWMHGLGRSGYCTRCLGELRNVVVHGTENEYRSGCRCEPCRLAVVAARRARRERSKVPCSHGCGTLVHPYNARYPGKPPECKPCSHERIHGRLKLAA